MGERILGRVRRQDMFSSFSTPYIGRGVWQGGRGTFNFRAFPVVVFFRGAGCWSGRERGSLPMGLLWWCMYNEVSYIRKFTF